MHPPRRGGAAYLAAVEVDDVSGARLRLHLQPAGEVVDPSGRRRAPAAQAKAMPAVVVKMEFDRAADIQPGMHDPQRAVRDQDIVTRDGEEHRGHIGPLTFNLSPTSTWLTQNPDMRLFVHCDLA